jgi:hypothetical protein
MFAHIHCFKCATNVDFILSWSLKIDKMSHRKKRSYNKGVKVYKFDPVESSKEAVNICPFQNTQLKGYDAADYDRVNDLCDNYPWIPHLQQMVLPCQCPCMPQESTQRKTRYFLHY